MVSDLFMKDWRAMTAAGVAFTPEDIVRLNALAVKVKLTKNPISAVTLPRACFLGDIVLREPTLGHEMWVDCVSAYIDLAANRNFQIVYAYALSRDWGDLPDAACAKRVVARVFSFARRHLLGLTAEQVGDAVDYVVFGADWKAGELAPAREDGDAAPDGPRSALGVWVGAVAKRIPLTLDDAKRLTASQILEITVRAEVADRRYDFDEERKAALKDYVRAREEVRARCRAT